MITRETLEKLHEDKVDKASLPLSGYGNKPVAMFVDGMFNPDNWSGGDAIIRQYIRAFKDSGKENEVFTDIDFNGRVYDLICYCTHYDETTYSTFVVIPDSDMDSATVDVAFFKVYKNRGKTEAAVYNGVPMNVDQYLLILNLLMVAGFKFNAF